MAKVDLIVGGLGEHAVEDDEMEVKVGVEGRSARLGSSGPSVPGGQYLDFSFGGDSGTQR